MGGGGRTKAGRHPGVGVGEGSSSLEGHGEPGIHQSLSLQDPSSSPQPREPVESPLATPAIKGLVLHTQGPTSGAALGDPPKSLTKRHREENQGAPPLGWGALKTIYPGVGEQAIHTAPAPPFLSRTFHGFLSLASPCPWGALVGGRG